MTSADLLTGSWAPDQDTIDAANLTRFLAWLADTGRGQFDDYHALWTASVADLEWFWEAVWTFFDVAAETAPTATLASTEMPGAQWFPGATLNYVTQAFRHATDARPAMVAAGEDGSTEWSWARLRAETAAFAAYLRSVGVGPGDRVVGYLPNVGEAVVAFLGAASVGATWAVCNQDLAVSGVVARLGQLEPKVLVASDGSVYAGKSRARHAEIDEIRSALTTLTATVVVPRLGEPVEGAVTWAEVLERGAGAELDVTAVAFDHPLWVLFSSGTTGTPKGIVHGHGGVLLEQLKYLTLQLDLTPEDRFLWQSSTSWMMWNMLVSGLLVGATIVLYDGSPTYGRTDYLWQVAAEHGVTVLGAGAGYWLACAKEELHPGRDHSLAALRTIGSTGSPLPASGFRWLQEGIGRPVPVFSMSGGTDVVTAFIGGCPLVPIRAGELNVVCLGVQAEAWVDGRPVVNEAGELVITQPMPSMPVFFWNDDDGEKYRAAYFDKYPGVWCHGDWITVTDRNSVVVHGRSDATLNRGGVRMGSAEVYDAVEGMPEIQDCLVVGVELPDGGYWMPLFVACADGEHLGDELRSRIVAAIRAGASPRHVPDDVIEVSGIPRTMTGKRLEIPIKRILLGAKPFDVLTPSAVDRPELLAEFEGHART
ncbi:acetoacetyl-CoA synthetase [Mycolicibacterium madagascariense]|uniref:Acetoacetyl-CoA synthetase n=1 Tax=Mycolicibacterium madagascariense TaxID=212765 RepID=A0A7I7XAQ7_9MYCO|nr:acetoacetate--CoA ligase [Mycolicibacterium madagascariense]MCV7014728.1 acetoacetate--CoA ligase [Mycolicibacterium madagascariense]BBZ26420.1 acetoacetyl-CoA synthetase [Mycolicibacterium madagascariense]